MSEIIPTSSGVGKLVQQECHQNTNHLILPKSCLGLTLGTCHTFNRLLRLEVSHIARAYTMTNVRTGPRHCVSALRCQDKNVGT